MRKAKHAKERKRDTGGYAVLLEGKEFLNEVDIIMEDAEAEKLRAREIIITHYADLG